MGLNVMLWHWGRGGAGTKFTLDLAEHLAARGRLGVHLSLSRQSGAVEAAEKLGLPGFHVDTFTGTKGSLPGLVSAAAGVPRLALLGRRFARYVEDNRIGLVICAMHTIWHGLVLRSLRATPARFAMILHDATHHPGDHYPFRETVLARQIAHSDGLAVLSDHVARMAAELHAYPPGRIWRMEHGAFDYGVAQPVRDFPANRPLRLLLFGRLVAYKGFDLLLESYGLLREWGLPVELSIVGSGDLDAYQTRIAALPDVTIVNRWIDDSEVANFLAAADLLVLPYIEASQSGVIAAACAAGLPAVVTPVGGLREQVRHGETGLVADGVDAASVARAVSRLVTEPGLYRACSQGAVDFARSELSWDRIAEKLEAICHQIAALPRRERGDGAAAELPPSAQAVER